MRIYRNCDDNFVKCDGDICKCIYKHSVCNGYNDCGGVQDENVKVCGNNK